VVVFDALMSGLPTHKEDFAGYSHLALFCLFSISLFTLTTQKVLSFLASVDVIFSGETCADAWIEKEARKNDLFTPKACSNRRLYENNC